MFRSPSPTDVGSHNPPSLGPASSLAHRPVFGSNTICNSLSSPLANIVHFGHYVSPLASRFKNSSTREKFLYPYEKYFILLSFLSPTDLGSHNPPSLGPTSSLAHHPVSGSNTICNSLSLSPPLADIVHFDHYVSPLTSRF